MPPTLAARVRLLDNTHSDKTDTHDARSTAIVALRTRQLGQIVVEDHHAVLRHRPGTPTLRVVTHSLHQGNLARPIASRATDGLAPADDTHVLRRS